MSFKMLPGNLGKIYVPESIGAKKNPCPDCFSCQWCSNERCRACTGKPIKRCQKLQNPFPRKSKS